MPKPETAVVYWLRDDRCVCLWRHGYVGVTVSWPHRLHRHRSEPPSAFLPDRFEGEVLFRGHIKECLAIERLLRPIQNIGWNRNPGGLSGHALKGIPKSPQQKEKMRQAAIARYAKPGEKEQTSKAVKRGLKNVDRSGTNNSMFGRRMSEATKEKIRDRIEERGGISGKNNPNYRHGDYCGD